MGVVVVFYHYLWKMTRSEPTARSADLSLLPIKGEAPAAVAVGAVEEGGGGRKTEVKR